MKLLVLSDIHGNLAALRAVLAEPHDAVLCLGDLVGYGPRPADCVAWARESGATVVAGNHDRTLTAGTHPGCRAAFLRLAEATVCIGHEQVTGGDLAWLGELPLRHCLALPASTLLVHATPSDPLYRYLGPDAHEWELETAGQEAALFLVGHTHLQFEIDIGGKRVVNPGSVGLPKDGGPRAAYAVIDDVRVELKRAAYDVAETITQLAASGLDARSVTELSELLRTGSVPQSLRS